jgi:Dolichyl-phosphate-mannose-protein mannosyltransferase
MKILYILLIALVCYSLPFLFTDEVISPDDLVYDFFSSHLAETGKIGYRPPGDAIFGREGFTPRYFVYNSSGETFPRKFPGFIIFWAGLKRILPGEASRLVNPICAVFALWMLFLIGKAVFPGFNTPIRAAILLATTPVFIRRTFAYNPTLFNLAIFLAALYFLIRLLQSRRLYFYLAFGVFAGAMIWIRPTNIVYLAGFAIMIFIERKKVVGKRLIILIILVVLFGGGLLLYNHASYGSFFNLGYTADQQPVQTSVSTKVPLNIRMIIDYLNFHPGIWMMHLKNAPLAFTLAFPLLIISLIGFMIPRQSRTSGPVLLSDEGTYAEAGSAAEEEGPLEVGDSLPIRFNLYYFWLFLISIVFFSNFATYGHEKGELILHSSYLRYLMPTLCLLPLFAARALERFSFPPIRLMAILAGFNLIVALVGPGGSVETIMQSRYYRECRSFLLENTDKKTVIFTYYWDKLVFPERMVYTHGTQTPSDEIGDMIRMVEEKGYRVVYPFNPCDSIIGDILRKDYRVKEITGPTNLSPLTRRAADFIPGDLYPVRLYTVVGLKPIRPRDASLSDKSDLSDLFDQ